jgi:dTDP-4-amino-4,6-dideoxygalactose transaminase
MTAPWVADKSSAVPRGMKYLDESCQNNYFANGGPTVCCLEKKMRTMLCIPDDKAVVAVCNATVGLISVANTINYLRETSGKPAVHWAVSSFTFPASVSGPFSECVIVDTNEDASLALDRVPDTCNGIVVTSVFGWCQRVEEYERWRHGAEDRFVLYDNATAPMTMYGGYNINSCGTAAVISLHHTKPLGFAEGGVVIVSKDMEWHFRRAINFGLEPRLGEPPTPWSRHSCNAKMSDVSAAFIISHLDNSDTVIQGGKQILTFWREEVKKIHGVQILGDDGECELLPSCIPLVFDEPVSCDDFPMIPHAKKYYKPLNDGPCANSVFDRIICLPCHHDVTEEHLVHMRNAVKALALSRHCTRGKPPGTKNARYAAAFVPH